MSLFIVRSGQLITPSVDQDILEGITRDRILTLARDLGIPTIERPVDKSELLIAADFFAMGHCGSDCASALCGELSVSEGTTDYVAVA